MMLFDTHAHLNAEQFDTDLEEVIARAKAEKVERIVVVGFDKPTITRAMELIEEYDFIYAAIGWHPVDAIDMTEEDLSWIKELSSHEKVVAIGEMALITTGINHQKAFRKKYSGNKSLSPKK